MHGLGQTAARVPGPPPPLGLHPVKHRADADPDILALNNAWPLNNTGPRSVRSPSGEIGGDFT